MKLEEHLIYPRVKVFIIALFIILSLIVLWIFKGILMLFFISLLLAYLIEPLFKFILRFQKNRVVSLILSYFIIFVFLGSIGIVLIFGLSNELKSIARHLPVYFENIKVYLNNLQNLLNSFSIPIDIRSSFNGIFLSQQYIQTHPYSLSFNESAKVLKTFLTESIRIGVSVFVVFMIAAFWIIDFENIKEGLLTIFPPDKRKEVIELSSDIDFVLKRIVRGQFLICLINGTLTTLALVILKIQYAILIGVLAGCLSVIPVFGTLSTTFPAVLLGLTQSWVVSLEVVIVILCIHWFESYVLSPKIMGKQAQIHPILVILALVSGEQLFGFEGLILAIPATGVLKVVILHYLKKAGHFEPTQKKED
ncbi:AI-2E family transporter [Thermodesulfobium sp.]|uniref:AI-2E family transporter n=1 Tax=Thermodesulfobium narugense TaxID=184064 RepID=A0A7C5KB76_9BACT